MKKYIFAAVLFSAITASGCGANTDKTANVNGSSAANTSMANNAGPNVSTAPNSGQLDQSINSGNSNVAGNYGVNSKTRPLADEPGSKPTQTQASVIAPENSTVSIGMNDAGAFVETRIFNGDPAIVKVEKVTNGKDRTAKIYLKSGKTVSFDAEQVPLINSIPLSKLRELAGISASAKDSGSAAPAAKP